MHSQRLQGRREDIAAAFAVVPETCPAVRSILETVMAEFMEEFQIDPSDSAIVDAIISRAFCNIRDQATQPLRQALVDAIGKSTSEKPRMPETQKWAIRRITTLINRGLRALDSVKHCGDKMTPEQREHDRKMRNTPPNQWTEQDVSLMSKTARRVNRTK